MQTSSQRSLTVLVHGLWMHGVSMEWQRHNLARLGVNAVCYSYPSMRLTLTENAQRLAEFSRGLSVQRINWFGHSLGGLVILRMLEKWAAELPPGRAVLAGTPYRDVHVGHVLSKNALGAGALGRSMREWLACEKPASFSGRDIGVVAGSLSLGLGRLVDYHLPLPNDGVITVAETQLSAARDSIVLRINHFGMLFSKQVARQAASFLRSGKFALDHEEAHAGRS